MCVCHHFRSRMEATPSRPVVLVRMSTPVRMQATRPGRGPMLAVRSWSLPSSSPATAWCPLNRGTAPVCTTFVPVGPTSTSVCATRWRPTLVSAERPESSCSGGARHCVVSNTHLCICYSWWYPIQQDDIKCYTISSSIMDWTMLQPSNARYFCLILN